ncbi:MAG: YdbH domain-containing protein [Candidatus Omnitrophica bacterium]|nr:YdbH domain-containing protein [Candidatus Omnitrophota bacterium]
MEEFVRDFNLGEKIRLSGKLAGAVILSGSGNNIKAVNGKFMTTGTGGVLIIKDNRFLENMARNSGQLLDILAESFKDYHYNTGVIKLSFDKGNLILDIVLEGDVGKRSLNIVLHDFKIGKGGYEKVTSHKS